MSRKAFSHRLRAFSLLSAILVTGTAKAWDPQTHAYASHLVIKELKQNNGWLEVPPYGKYQVPAATYSALLNHEGNFYSGSFLMDFAPDIYVAQAIYHPDTRNNLQTQPTNFSSWLQKFWTDTNNWPSVQGWQDLPGQSLAFGLGLQVHAAQDLFGHTFINQIAGGPFPTISDGVTDAEKRNIMRHMASEAYVRFHLPEDYINSLPIGESKEIRAYLAANLVANGNKAALPAYNGDINASLGPLFAQPMNQVYFNGLLPPHLTLLMQMRAELAKNASANQEHIRLIDKALGVWVGIVTSNAKKIMTDGYFVTKPAYELYAKTTFLSAMAGSESAGNFALFASMLSKVLPIPDAIDPMAYLMDYLKDTLINQIMSHTLGLSLDDIKRTREDTLNVLMETGVSTGSIDGAMRVSTTNPLANLHNQSSPTSTPFEALYNSMVMTKLVLLGPTGLDQLISTALGRPVNFYSAQPNQAFMAFLPSMDDSFQWRNNDFPLWANVELRGKVFQKIFKGMKEFETFYLPDNLPTGINTNWYPGDTNVVIKQSGSAPWKSFDHTSSCPMPSETTFVQKECQYNIYPTELSDLFYLTDLKKSGLEWVLLSCDYRSLNHPTFEIFEHFCYNPPIHFRNELPKTIPAVERICQVGDDQFRLSSSPRYLYCDLMPNLPGNPTSWDNQSTFSILRHPQIAASFSEWDKYDEPSFDKSVEDATLQIFKQEECLEILSGSNDLFDGMARDQWVRERLLKGIRSYAVAGSGYNLGWHPGQFNPRPGKNSFEMYTTCATVIGNATVPANRWDLEETIGRGKAYVSTGPGLAIWVDHVTTGDAPKLAGMGATCGANFNSGQSRNFKVYISSKDGADEQNIKLFLGTIGGSETQIGPDIKAGVTPANQKGSLNSYTFNLSAGSYYLRAESRGTYFPEARVAFSNPVWISERVVNFSAVVKSQETVELSWEEGVQGLGCRYTIQRRPVNSTTWTSLGSTPFMARSFTDTGVACGLTYEYRIQPQSLDDFPVKPNDWAFTQVATPACSPHQLTAGADTSTTINLNWEDSSGNTSFLIERTQTPNDASSWRTVATVNSGMVPARSYRDLGLSPATTYAYRVSYPGRGATPSNIATATTLAAGPSSLTAIGFAHIKLSWSEIPNASGYALERRIGSGSYEHLAFVPASTRTYTDTSLGCGKSASYRVRAYWTIPGTVLKIYTDFSPTANAQTGPCVP